MTMLQYLQSAMLRGESPDGPMVFPPPIQRLIGFRPVSLEPGATVFQLEVRKDRHSNPMGTVHGGILVDLADAAMGIASATLLERGESFTTVELKINFFRPVVDGLIEARARIVHRGRTLHYAECDVVTIPEEKRVARTSSTLMILRPGERGGPTRGPAQG